MLKRCFAVILVCIMIVSSSTVFVSAEDTVYEKEPNNSESTAQRIYHDDIVVGGLDGILGDFSDFVDYYTFVLGKTEMVRITAMSSNSNYGFRLDGPSGYVTGSNSEGTYGGKYVEEIEMTLSAGTYYVSVVGTSYSDFTYALSLYAPSATANADDGSDTECKHSYETVVTAPTCEAQGFTTHTCTICGDSYVDTYVEALGHSYGEGVVTKVATCIENGEITYTCSLCGYSYTELTPFGSHNYEGRVCTFCGDVDYEIGDVNGDGNVNTSDAKLIMQYELRLVDESKMNLSVADANDDGKVNTSDAKLIMQYELGLIPEMRHNWVAATCTEPKTCTSCGITEGSPLGHDWEDATCTEAKFCKTCGTTEGSTLDHDWAEATCTAPKTCTSCGITEGSPLDHEWIGTTCTEPGVCSRCGAIEDKALGHTTTNGTCTRCGQFLYETLVYSGYGDDVITGIDLPAGSYRITLTHNGSRNYIVKLYYGDSDYDYELFANERGVYTGECAFTSEEDAPINDGMLEIKADGYWTISIEKFTDTCTTNIQGKGDKVTGIITATGGRTAVKMTHDGDRNFIVKIYELDGDTYDYDLLVNEIGQYTGSKVVTLTEGKRYYIEIQADGNWTIDFGEGATLTDYRNNTSGDTGTDDSGGSDDDGSQEDPSGPAKWSFNDASKLNDYSDKATDAMNNAADYINNALGASSISYKCLYYNYAISYTNDAKSYLELMKDLADNRVDLELISSDFDTIQDMIDYTLSLCDDICDLDITSDNYTLYEDLIFDVAWDVYTLCLRINSLSVELLELFV